MKNILLLLFISYFIISCSSNTKTPFEEEAYKMLKTEISDTFSSVGNDVDILNTSTEYYTDSFDEKLYHLCRVYAATKAYAKQLKKKYKLN